MIVYCAEVASSGVYKPFCPPESCPVACGMVDLDKISASACFAASKALYAILENVLGYTQFRAGQLLAAVAA